jgi:NitT/TauT family transport system permease protein
MIGYAVIGPVGTVKAIGAAWDRGWLVPAFASTLKATAIGFVLSGSLGILFGFMLGRSRFWAAVLEEPLLWIYAIPKIVLYPILVLLLGLGIKSSVAFAILQGIFPPLLILLNAVRDIPPVYVKLARMQRLSNWRFFRQVVMPYTLPSIVLGLQYCFSLSYIGVVVSQMFAAEDGAGYELIKAISLNQNAKMFAIVAVLMVIALAINFLFLALERRIRVHRPDPARIAA